MLSPAHEEYLEGLIQYTGYRWTVDLKLCQSFLSIIRTGSDGNVIIVKKTITVCNRYDADRDLDLQVERFIGANDSPFTLQFRDVDKYLRDLLLLYRL